MSENEFKMPPDLPEHIAVWFNYNQREVWQRVLADGGDETIAGNVLVNVPAVSALEALAANRAAVDLLVGRRWLVMQSAREAGETWETIGDALGITKQGAQDYYRRQIELQEAFAPRFHDAPRAKAALDSTA